MKKNVLLVKLLKNSFILAIVYFQQKVLTKDPVFRPLETSPPLTRYLSGRRISGEGRGEKTAKGKREGEALLFSPQSPLPFPSPFGACYPGYLDLSFEPGNEVVLCREKSAPA